MAIKHAFTSAIEDGVDDTLVQPSDWNADHTGSNLTVQEADGTPSVAGVVTMIVPNGSLTDNTGGSVTVDLVKNPMTTAGDIIYGGASGVPTRLAKGTEGQVLTMGATNPAWAATSGGMTTPPTTVQSKVSTTQATSIVLDSAPTNGNVLLLFSDSTTGQISNVACTNVTWTQLATFTSAGASYYALWVGRVSASADTTITCTKPGTFNSMCVLEVDLDLTPSLGTYSFGATTTFRWLQGLSRGQLVVVGIGVDNTVLDVNIVPFTTELTGQQTGTEAVALAVMYAAGGLVSCGFISGNVGATIMAVVS